MCLDSIVDILVSDDRTEHTVLWFDDEKFMVEAKTRQRPK